MSLRGPAPNPQRGALFLLSGIASIAVQVTGSVTGSAALFIVGSIALLISFFVYFWLPS